MTLRKSILVDANSMTGKKPTGIGYYTAGLAKALSRIENLEVTLYYFNFMKRHNFYSTIDPLVNHIQITHVPTRLVSILGRKFGFRFPFHFLITRSFDWTIYTNYVSFSSRQSQKNALVIHDLAFLDLPHTLDEKNLSYLRKVVPPSIRDASKIITISEFSKTRLLHHYPNEVKADDVIVTGIPPVFIKKSQKETILKSRLTKLGVQKNNYILFLGTLEPRKNLGPLVSAFKSLSAIDNEICLVLAGQVGWKSEELIEQIGHAQSCGAKIILPGYVSDNERQALYANCRSFIMPSLYEGFGMPILEAMQYGKLCILSDIPVFREVAGESAIYFDPLSEASITRAIQTSIRHYSVDKEKYQKILSRYTWDNVANKIMTQLT